MKLALYLPNFRDKVTISELVDLAHLAEDLEFDSIWTLDRIVVPEASDRQELRKPFGFMKEFPLALPVASRGEFLHGFPLVPYLAAITKKIRVGVSEGQSYLSDFLKKRMQDPRQDDIVDAILHFEFADGTPYTDADRTGSLAQIVAAGSTTTGAVISGAIYHLATHPEDRRLLRADSSLIPRAVEEFLRVYVSAPNNGRRVTKDIEIAGTQLRGPRTDSKGDYIIYNLGGANRDPAVFECPEKVNIGRHPNPHLSFAKGPHRCIGMQLARLNLKIVIETFLTRIRDFSIRSDYQLHFMGGITRSLIELPVTFDTRPSPGD
jgi:cytochrome P450